MNFSTGSECTAMFLLFNTFQTLMFILWRDEKRKKETMNSCFRRKTERCVRRMPPRIRLIEIFQPLASCDVKPEQTARFKREISVSFCLMKLSVNDDGVVKPCRCFGLRVSMFFADAGYVSRKFIRMEFLMISTVCYVSDVVI